MKLSSLLELGFVVFCWSINPHIKKHIMLKNSQANYYFINSFTIMALIQLMYAVFYVQGTFSPITLKIPSAVQCGLIVLSASISVFSSFFVARLINATNISKLVPKLQPSVIIVTVLIAYLQGESITTRQWIGIGCIAVGIGLTI